MRYIQKLLRIGEVVVIAPNDCARSFSLLEELGVIVKKISNIDTFFGKLKAVYSSNFYVLHERLLGSVFICHFLVTFLTNYITMVPFNRRLIIYTEGLGSFFTRSAAFRSLLKILLVKNRAMRLFCNASEKQLIGDTKDVVTGGIGIDLSKFRPQSTQIILCGTRKLLFVGRLIKDKGIYDALYVLRKLRSDGLDVSLTVVGDVYPSNPTSMSHHDIEAVKNELGDSVDFVGYSHNVISYYEDADVLIFPSIREGFPVSVMEANAMGIPVVGYYVPGVSDAVRVGVNGLLATYGDREELYRITKEVIDVHNANNYRSNSIQFARKNFSDDEKSQYLVDQLQLLVDK
ncbi:glycosyltransferase [Rubritalea halochordaticola]|uniref:glycosyltransferase n=1 Tax=Rubritalea halochordaticola TaxID=714537 RepID=UPI0031FCEDF5